MISFRFPARLSRLALAATALAGATHARPVTAQGSSTVLLRGGTVIDGTGAPARVADVLIRGGVIQRIAPTIAPPTGARIVNATGLVVAPGFIDPHAHISSIAQSPMAENFLRQGVTTIVNSLHSLDQPYPLGAFLDTLRVAPNTLWTAGHTWLRKRVMGTENRAPTAAELDTMRAYVARAMNDGAYGLGTGLEYVPAVYAERPELVALASAARRPHSVYVTHLRDEGAALEQALAEAIEVGQRSHQPVHVSHLKSTGTANWGKSAAVLRGFDSLAARGQRVTFDVYPYPAYSTYSDVLFPGWALADGPDAVKRRLSDSVVVARLRREMPAVWAAQTGGTAASILFRTVPSAPELVGKTLADYLAARGRKDDIEQIITALIELQRAGGFTATVQAMNEGDIEAFMKHRAAMISTDGDLVTPGQGFPHPRSYGAFPRMIAEYVDRRHVLSLEAAIERMTSRAARAFTLRDRGMLRAGMTADVVVFDRARLRDVATFTDPHHYATGVVHLYVNGTAVISNGALTGARPGAAIRRPQ